MRGVTPLPGRGQYDRPDRAHQRVPSPYRSRHGDGFYDERDENWSEDDEDASEPDIYIMLGMDGTGYALGYGEIDRQIYRALR